MVALRVSLTSEDTIGVRTNLEYGISLELELRVSPTRHEFPNH